MGRKQDSGGIRVLERTVIARDSFLLIVEIQGTVMVLGYLLRESRSAIWNPMNPENTQSTSFSSVFAGQLRERMSGEKDGQGRGRRDEMMEESKLSSKTEKTALTAAGLMILTTAFVLMFYKISLRRRF